MRLLFTIDKKDYIENGTVFIRPSVRGIIIKNEKLAMVYSKKYNYYKFPGGGINENESHIDTLIREVCEETGMIVNKSTIKEYGLVIKKQKGIKDDLFIQNNYYYFCDVLDELVNQKLDDYELKEGFVLEWVDLKRIIEVNSNHNYINDEINGIIERDTKVVELLLNK